MEYVIVGDTPQYKGCLVYTCGSLENAQKVLKGMLTNPTENDKKLMKHHENFRIEEVEDKDCWWNFGTD